jgi:hypothetical protein
MLPNVRILALALPLAVLSSGCITIPQLEDRVVELAVGASTTEQFVATGSINTFDESRGVDLKSEIDLAQVLDDNGVDVGDVKDIKVSGLSYRIVKAQTGRSIQGGYVKITRQGGTEKDLVLNFNASAATADGWITVRLESDGVTVLNALLADLLKDVQHIATATNTQIQYHVHGNSVPGAPSNTDFTWEIKLDVSIVGTVKVTVLN